MSEAIVIPIERIERRIVLLRGQKVMLDRDLAELYGVETRVLNQAVRRNARRFPADFMFELSREEIAGISQIVTSPDQAELKYSKSVLAFTEQGVAMLSGVLNSARAVEVNIAIMRTFVQLRQMLASHAGLSARLAALEKNHDARFKQVFDAIRELMSDKKLPNREIGFHTTLPRTGKDGGTAARARKL